ncbi:MAG TPA: TRIC cation channel family protein [Mycobacterium sp.]
MESSSARCVLPANAPVRATANTSTSCPPLLVLDLAGTVAFALNGALIAVRAARLDGHLEHPNSSPSWNGGPVELSR